MFNTLEFLDGFFVSLELSQDRGYFDDKNCIFWLDFRCFLKLIQRLFDLSLLLQDQALKIIVLGSGLLLTKTLKQI